MKKIEITDSVRTVRLVIECPSRCVDAGCSDNHGDSGWRKSVELSPHMSIDDALAAMRAHAALYPQSGPFRLMRYVETVEKTQQVLS